HLEAGRLEMLGAFVPRAAHELGERRRERMHRILGELRVSDVALHAMNDQTPAEGPAAAHLDGVADGHFTRGLAHDTPIDALAACREQFHDAPSAIDRRSLLIARDQEGDRAGVQRMAGDELLGGGHHRHETALHIRGAPAIEDTVADLGHEWVAVPLLEWAGGHHIGMPGEAEQRSSVAAARPEVRDAAKWERLNHESDPRKALREKCLAALIGGGYGTTGNEIYSQFNGLRHRLAVIRPHLQRGKRCAPSCLCKELR